MSLRGTKGTDAGKGIKKVTISDHVDDINSFVIYVTCVTGEKPVLIVHLFGGAAIMKFLEQDSLLVQEVSLLCSVPPSGNGKMTLRFLRRSLLNSWKITSGLAMKKCIVDVDLCRTLFFGDNYRIRDKKVLQIQSRFKEYTVATIDIGDFVKTQSHGIGT